MKDFLGALYSMHEGISDPMNILKGSKEGYKEGAEEESKKGWHPKSSDPRNAL